MTLAITAEHLEIVNKILRACLPVGTQVWVYGSRAEGRGLWRGSDLDLMVRGPTRLSLELCELLAEEFSESLLPYMVDLHDWHRTDPEFRALIESGMVPLPATLDAEPDGADEVRSGHAS